MIPVRNIYYMLSYAFKSLNEQGYKNMETEQFNNAADLFSEIIIRGVKAQLRRGLGKEYIPRIETTACVRGKIDVTASIKDLSLTRGQLVCSYDEFSANSYLNRIIKTTMELLYRSSISADRKRELRRLLVLFRNVDAIDTHTINWHFNFDRNNQNYELLMGICRLVIQGMIQTTRDGSGKYMDYLDEQQTHRLYEKFILEYYRKEYPQIYANPDQISWQLDDGFREMLPVMKTDILLSYKKRHLIIDAKYYSHSLQKQFGHNTVYSGHLYQMFAYVKNREGELADIPHDNVAGILLYAQTEDEGAFDVEYQMSGNPICAKTLDLSSDFAEIKRQLDMIAENYLHIHCGTSSGLV